MAVTIDYIPRGPNHRHQVAIVYCPSIAIDRLLHLSKDEGEERWRIRDYIGGQIGSSGYNENSSVNIEDHVLFSLKSDEYPDTIYNVEDNDNNWKELLQKLTNEKLLYFFNLNDSFLRPVKMQPM